VTTAIEAGRQRMAAMDIASRAAVLSFASNLLLMLMKVAIGLAFGSVALLGDGVDSAEDVFASGLAFFTVRLALQPADETHPYGHGKAESLAALSQAALIAGGGAFVAIAAVRRLITHDVEIAVGPSLAATGVTVAANLGVAGYAFRAARISGSVAIAADARHLLTNIVQAGAIAVALVLVGVTGKHAFDPAVALLLAAYLGWTAYGIARTALRELVDTALPEATVEALRACLAHESHGMRGYHRLRTRKSGRQRHIDLHVLVDPQLTVSEAHALVEDLEGDIHRIIPGAVITIHLDPDEPGIMDSCGDEDAWAEHEHERGLGLHID
jgi:cation diffusion facilitator family transporter